jgi:hypothetical protein
VSGSWCLRPSFGPQRWSRPRQARPDGHATGSQARTRRLDRRKEGGSTNGKGGPARPAGLGFGWRWDGFAVGLPRSRHGSSLALLTGSTGGRWVQFAVGWFRCRVAEVSTRLVVCAPHRLDRREVGSVGGGPISLSGCRGLDRARPARGGFDCRWPDFIVGLRRSRHATGSQARTRRLDQRKGWLGQRGLPAAGRAVSAGYPNAGWASSAIGFTWCPIPAG